MIEEKIKQAFLPPVRTQDPSLAVTKYLSKIGYPDCPIIFCNDQNKDKGKILVTITQNEIILC